MKRDSFFKIFEEKDQHKIVTAVFTLFAIMVFGRLSAITDYIFTKLNLDLFNRLSTKIVWLAFYVIFILIVGVILFKYFGRAKTLISEFLQQRRTSLIVITVFLVSLAVTLPFAFNKTEAVIGYSYYLVLASIPIFLWFILEGVEKHNLTKSLLNVINSVSIILFCVSVIQYIVFNMGGTQNLIIKFFDKYSGFMPISFFVFAEGAGSVIRPSSLMGDPNFLAVFVATLIIFGIDFLIQKYRNEKQINWMTFFVVLLNISNLLITGSRTGLLVICVELVVYISVLVILSRKHKPNVNKILVSGIFSNYFTRFSDAINLKDSSTLQHLGFAKVAWEMFLKNPIAGVGIANYPLYYKEYFDKSTDSATPHSIYFQFLAEVGIIGTGGFLVLIGYILKQLVKSKNAVYMAIFIGILIGNITYDYFMTPWVWFYIGLFLL